ncbi:DUF6932 family protein [Larkinella soli]|uniref:DUF6932 family protein n=1 Tax=Larkinella soli TaxID=1770527 RepID=UPI000FFC0B33|nr:hypothetical protein [Larkinella soli]
MHFDQHGFLTPYGVIETDFSIFEQVFVSAFPESTTRRALFDGLMEFDECLQKLLPEGYFQWIDGSFVTKKLNPADIDLVTFVDYRWYERQESAFNELRAWRFDREKGIDGYFVKIYPEDHPLVNGYRYDKTEWAFTFSKTAPKPGHQRRNKGFIQLTF